MSKDTISFATCNLLNLNLPGKRIYRDKDGWENEVYDRKIAWTTKALQDVAADVWGFQELWHEEPLKQAFKDAKLTDDYELLVPKNHSGTSIVCAGAVRKGLLVGEPEWIVDFPDDFELSNGGSDEQSEGISVTLNTFSRPVLRFTIAPNGKEPHVSVYVVHFKSKNPEDIDNEAWYKGKEDYYKKHEASLGYALSTIRRSAEAAALRMYLVDVMKGTETPVVVMGDFNDEQHSNTLNIVTGQPPYLLLHSSKGGHDDDLYTTGTLQEYRSLRDVYYTYIYQDFKSSIDHILVSKEFYDNSNNRIWEFTGMDIWNDHLHAEKKEIKAAGTSDHGVVKASFHRNPVKKKK